MSRYNPKRHKENPIVFFDVSMGGQPAGRILVELFKDVCPKTVENFRQLCTGEHRENGVPIGYKNTLFHRVIKDFMVQGGDFVRGDATGSMSIYGEKFPVENFTLKHDESGLLSMATSNKSVGCQFFLTCAKCDWLDGEHSVFGAVLDQPSMLVLRKIENVEVADGRPKLQVLITQCVEM